MTENFVALSPNEEAQLASLLKRARWPLSSAVFAAGVNTFVSNPIELVVFDNDGRVLMFYRKDDEYEGNHIPGTVLRDNENVPTAIDRLLNSEVVGGEVTPPIELGWIEIPKGTGDEQNPTRHEISLLHACWLKKPYQGKGGKFYSPSALPEDTLPHHRKLIREIVSRIRRHR